ncbi:hypothetical protein [Brevifollis gellanilyticus]|uniref:Uncharacterized protein n=1 Tax=Brevifollis gellanilyticus TaxID=748831 RepID=A0A512MB76_9BACT|nr:hypothetical protein [Brevifollis gellanilyticus]GEP43980.1 hypothetical protein BGE01nite_32710 [Brevifollis gellanilyticus]
MQKIALPLVCLLVGGAAGYSLSSFNNAEPVQPAKLVAAKSEVAKKTAEAPSTGSTATSKVTPVSASGPLDHLLKDLVADYDLKSAQRAVGNLSVSEIQTALAQTAQMPKSTDRDALRAQLYRAWAAKDPQAAWQAALADPQSKNNGSLLGAVAGELAKTDPKAAIEMTLKLNMGDRRATVMRALFTEWAKVDAAAALNYSNAHPELPVDSYAFSTGLSRLAAKDPANAAKLALTMKDSLTRGSSLSAVMTAWIGKNPGDAVAWAQSLSDPSQRRDAIAAAIGAWAKVDPQAALAHAESITDPDTRANTLKKGFNDWFRMDPTAATAYMAAPGNEDIMQSMGYSFGYLTDSLTPQERATLLAQLPEGKAKEDMLRGITAHLSRKGQFNQALEMLNAMPDSTMRDYSVAKLGEDWATTDLTAAGNWLKIQPASTDRDLATAGYANTLARTDPKGALQWVESIPDPKLRQSAQRNIAVRWLRTDPPQAQAWINTANFSSVDLKMIETMSKMSGDFVPTLVTVGQRH